MDTKESSRVPIQHSQSRVHRDHVRSYTTSILTSLDLKRLECYTLQILTKQFRSETLDQI